MPRRAPDGLALNIEHRPNEVVDDLWELTSSDMVAWCLLAALSAADTDAPRGLLEVAQLLTVVEARGTSSLPTAMLADWRMTEVTGWVGEDRIRDSAGRARRHLAAHL